jgi:phosphoribosylformylglycinamidine synthase
MQWRADIAVMLKPGVNDPQGLAVRDGLHRLGYAHVQDVRVGRYIQLWLAADSETEAAAQVEAMCQQLLANPVIEQFWFSLTAQPVLATDGTPRDGGA